MITTTPYMAQTPSLSLYEIAGKLWTAGEFEAYRALMAYIKERDTMLAELKEQT